MLNAVWILAPFKRGKRFPGGVMSGVVDLGTARLEKKVKKAYRNWTAQFGDNFDSTTGFGDIQDSVLAVLAAGTGNSSFYFYDLIMNLEGMGSGFSFNELEPDKKLVVLDRHLLLLDRSRFEYMKRLGWITSYPGEEITLVELILNFNNLLHSGGFEDPNAVKSSTIYKNSEKYKKWNIKKQKKIFDIASDELSSFGYKL